MWENAYLSIKNQKASRALKQALAPNGLLHSRNSTLLHQQLLVSEPMPPLDKILDPHLMMCCATPGTYANEYSIYA